METSFHERAKNLREKILTCKSREELLQAAKTSELEFRVSYQNSLTILEENFSTETFEGLFHVHVTCYLIDGDKKIQRTKILLFKKNQLEKIQKS